jgi:hypothetical protein
VLPYFEANAEFVVGNVTVKSFRLGRSFRNVARVGLKSMMRHWERNAYCYNPVGYFYTRKVQETVSFNINNNFTMDLEFLLAAGSKFSMVKIDKVLGYYDEGLSSKTTRSQADQGYWSMENFSYIEQYISELQISEQDLFRRDRQKGYARITRYWRRNAKIVQFREKIRAIGKMIFPR